MIFLRRRIRSQIQRWWRRPRRLKSLSKRSWWWTLHRLSIMLLNMSVRKYFKCDCQLMRVQTKSRSGTFTGVITGLLWIDCIKWSRIRGSIIFQGCTRLLAKTTLQGISTGCWRGFLKSTNFSLRLGCSRLSMVISESNLKRTPKGRLGARLLFLSQKLHVRVEASS